jgi:hypothetical protein
MTGTASRDVRRGATYLSLDEGFCGLGCKGDGLVSLVFKGQRPAHEIGLNDVFLQPHDIARSGRVVGKC